MMYLMSQKLCKRESLRIWAQCYFPGLVCERYLVILAILLQNFVYDIRM